MHYFYSILIGLFNAILCAHYAKKRGRSPLHWFIWGAFFGLIALATLFLLPRQKVASPIVVLKQKTPVLEPVSPSQANILWYYLDCDKNQQGPMSLAALSKAFHLEEIQRQTYVWNEELDGWKYLESVFSLPVWKRLPARLGDAWNHAITRHLAEAETWELEFS